MKILVSDFDGTIYLSDEKTLINKKAIDDFRDKGNLLIIATGRRLSYLLEDLYKYQISFDYLICNDGAMIYDSNLNCISVVNIPSDAVLSVIKIIEQTSNQEEWYLDDGDNYTKDSSKKINKIIIDSKKMDESQEVLDKILFEVKEVNGYISNHWINLVSRKVNKSNAIKQLLSLEKLFNCPIYSVGNNVNDIEMLQDFNGYFIKNSNQDIPKGVTEIKSVANLIDEILKKE